MKHVRICALALVLAIAAILVTGCYEFVAPNAPNWLWLTKPTSEKVTLIAGGQSVPIYDTLFYNELPRDSLGRPDSTLIELYLDWKGEGSKDHKDSLCAGPLIFTAHYLEKHFVEMKVYFIPNAVKEYKTLPTRCTYVIESVWYARVFREIAVTIVSPVSK